MLEIIENQKFQKLKSTETPLKRAEYEYCEFEDCDFPFGLEQYNLGERKKTLHIQPERLAWVKATIERLQA